MPSRHYVLVSLIRTLRARLPSLRSVVPSRHLTPIANYGQAIPVANNPQCQYFCADAYSIQERKNSKLVNAVSLPAQSVHGTFAIVKSARRKYLWIIKTMENLLRENFHEKQGNFRDKAPRKNYLRANFHGLAYNFYGHIRQFFRSYRIVSP